MNLEELARPLFDAGFSESPAPSRSFQLKVHHFLSNLDELKGSTNEAQTRVEFINPLLDELGWDVRNSKGLPPSLVEVFQEPRQLVANNTKAPDYCMSIGGSRKFYLEAKRPSEPLLESKAHAFQIRRYSWNAGMPIGLLTNFEKFAIYNTRISPRFADPASHGRMTSFKLEDLLENWNFFYAIFSRDSVERGSLSIISDTKSASKGTETLDAAFTKMLRKWRLSLATSLAKLNPELHPKAVDYESQSLINRVLFLRILEDRGLEPEESLKFVSQADGNILEELRLVFERANGRYNAGLFSGKGLSSKLSSDLGVEILNDPKVVTELIEDLYFPNPFEFSVMPADILGQIYELMLAEAVVIDQDRRVSIELKPDLKKRGGVVYTPQPVVRYIVEETLAGLTGGKTFDALKKQKILDPACGSGTFLVEAFQFLIDQMVDFASKTRGNSTKFLETGLDGQPRLRTSYRRELLTNCLYGVDIDSQAVETTKLSLFLKLIENENSTVLVLDHLLPNLDRQIVVGNSLIGSDFAVPRREIPEYDDEFDQMDWTEKFPEVMAAGGFEAVIGNPPYLNIDAVWGSKDPRAAYLKSVYPHIHTDKTDLYYYFLEKSVQLCKGEIGMIVSRSMMEAEKAKKLRGWLASAVRVRSMLDFRSAPVFPGVGIATMILRLTKSEVPKKFEVKRWKHQVLPPGYDKQTLRSSENFEISVQGHESLSQRMWSFGDNITQDLLDIIDSKSVALEEVMALGQGFQTGGNKSFELGWCSQEQLAQLIELGFAKARVPNSQIQAFYLLPGRKYMLFLENAASFSDLPTFVQDHLRRERSNLESRAAFKRGDCEWWKYTWPLHLELFMRPKIVTSYRGKRNAFAVANDPSLLFLTDTSVIYNARGLLDEFGVCAVLNSKILNFRFHYMTKLTGNGQKEFFANQLAQLPIPATQGNEASWSDLSAAGRTISDLQRLLATTLDQVEVSDLQASIEAEKDRVETTLADLYGLNSRQLAEIHALDASLI